MGGSGTQAEALHGKQCGDPYAAGSLSVSELSLVCLKSEVEVHPYLILCFLNRSICRLDVEYLFIIS